MANMRWEPPTVEPEGGRTKEGTKDRMARPIGRCQCQTSKIVLHIVLSTLFYSRSNWWNLEKSQKKKKREKRIQWMSDPTVGYFWRSAHVSFPMSRIQYSCQKREKDAAVCQFHLPSPMGMLHRSVPESTPLHRLRDEQIDNRQL